MKRASTLVAVGLMFAAILLLIQPILKVRQAALRTQCSNNLRHVGLALHNYLGFNRKFPLAVTKPTVDYPIDKCISWWAEIDPYIESAPRLRIDLSKPWDAEVNQTEAERWYGIAHCPANRQATFSRSANSYIAILGLGTDSGKLTIDSVKRGVFSFRDQTTIDDIKDGTSTTMVLAETAYENGSALAAGHPTARGLDNRGPKYLGRAGQFSSFHLDTINILMADGSVRRLTDQITPNVFEALATIAGGEKIEPFREDKD